MRGSAQRPANSGSRGPAAPQGLACGGPPPSAPVPAYPRESTSLLPPPPAIFPRLVMSMRLCPLPLQSELISQPTFMRALPPSRQGSRSQTLTPSAEDTWLWSAPSPSLGLSFSRCLVGSKPESVGDAGACAQAFPFLWGRTARAPSRLLLAIRPQTLFPEIPECVPVLPARRRVRCNVWAALFPSAGPLPGLSFPKRRDSPARAGRGCWRKSLTSGWAPAREEAHSSHFAAQGRLESPLQEASLSRPAPPLPSAPWQTPPAPPSSACSLSRHGNQILQGWEQMRLWPFHSH